MLVQRPMRKLSTWSFHKTLSDCQVLSAGILLKADKTSSAEAALWVRLEGALDQPEHTAISLGILLVDNNGDTISDLHGINFWPAARIAIRNSALLPLLQAK